MSKQYEFAVRWINRDGIDHATTGLSENSALLEWSRMHGAWHLGWCSDLRVERRSVGGWETVDIPIANGDLRGAQEGACAACVEGDHAGCQSAECACALDERERVMTHGRSTRG